MMPSRRSPATMFDGLGEELVGLLEHLVAVGDVGLPEALRVALAAGVGDALAFGVEGLGIEAGHVTGLDDLEQGGRLALGVEHAETLEIVAR